VTNSITKFEKGHPSKGVKPGWGIGKTRIFLVLSGNISKTVRDTNGKLLMSFRLAPRLMTLDDIELL